MTGRPEPTRRQVLCGLAIALLAPAGLAACDSGSAPSSSDGADEAVAKGGVLAKVSDVPVGGGKLVETVNGMVLLTQPTAGTIKAFNAICTHQGFVVDPPVNGTIICTLGHGSQFDATDGSVKLGPATAPLQTMSIKITGETITLA